MSLSIEKPKPLYDQVYETIRANILSGKFPYDERINEIHLSQELNISRGPIRESIRRLEQEGLLVRDEKNQIYPYRSSVEDLVHIYQCRTVLEGLAAELAAKNGTDEEKEELKKIIRGTKELIGNDEAKDHLVQLNGRFHDQIIMMSRNPRLEQQTHQLRSLTFIYRVQNVKGLERQKQIYKEHLLIFEAIHSGKSDLARKSMSSHIEHDAEHLITIFKEENK
ncbi:GntR family transcriptional regulator [Neobacillus mesonae]|uniref:GntR family transcriptional regulator n=1 Tax=Neobacillus mesonae TaxID=1193713 RepID=UPI00203FBEAB|nr:GntR family transcriptional regulator [Neobacillus mesonae]MCM3568483.1 GntR family transcriptional regulator [Neobacillus mesonae]